MQSHADTTDDDLALAIAYSLRESLPVLEPLDSQWPLNCPSQDEKMARQLQQEENMKTGYSPSRLSTAAEDERLALHLQEEENRGRRHGTMTDTADEELARKLQEEENSVMQHRIPTTSAGKPEGMILAQRLRGDDSQANGQERELNSVGSRLANLFGRGAAKAPKEPAVTADNKCHGCQRALEGRYIVVGQATKYHPGCFLCAGCGMQISADHMTKDHSSDCFHVDCFRALFSRTCDLCGAHISGSYNCHGFFKDEQCYCASHVTESLRQCFCCHLKEPFHQTAGQGLDPRPRSEPFPCLPDGRLICWKCIDHVVVDSEEARPLYLEAVEFLERCLGLPIPPGMREVPVLAVDLFSLNDQLSVMASSVHCSTPHPDTSCAIATAATASGSLTRGLTLTQVSEVKYVSRGGGGNWSQARLGRRGGGGADRSSSSVMTLNRSASVTAVLVLCGLPKDLTTSILAHEAMHVWCKLRTPPLLNLPPTVEEGICQLVAYEYLDRGLQSVGDNSMATWEDKLRSYFKYQIQIDDSPVYGDGFRMAAEAAAAVGFEATVDHIADSNNFPQI